MNKYCVALAQGRMYIYADRFEIEDEQALAFYIAAEKERDDDELIAYFKDYLGVMQYIDCDSDDNSEESEEIEAGIKELYKGLKDLKDHLGKFRA